jgi:hypothetical protein
MSLLARSRLAERLTKLANAIESGLLQDVPMHGTAGRIAKGAAPGLKVKMPQGPRAYAPRIKKHVT